MTINSLITDDMNHRKILSDHYYSNSAIESQKILLGDEIKQSKYLLVEFDSIDISKPANSINASTPITDQPTPSTEPIPQPQEPKNNFGSGLVLGVVIGVVLTIVFEFKILDAQNN